MGIRIYQCPMCGEWTIIMVGKDMVSGKVFYSCTTEDCEWEAQLLVRLEDGPFIPFQELVNQFIEVVKDSE